MIKTYLMAALLAMACAFVWQGAAGKKDNNSPNAQAKIKLQKHGAIMWASLCLTT
jgi:hypothetical protein